MLASSSIKIDGKDWARLKQIPFGDAVALAPILSAIQHHHDQSVITLPNANVFFVPGFDQQDKRESMK